MWVFIAVSYALVLAAALGMWTLRLDISHRYAPLIVAAVMWSPALARAVAVATVDRGWQSPLPLSGAPLTSAWLPALIELAIYAAPYGIGAATGLARWDPPWHGFRLIANVALNLAILMLVGFAGSVGEELGWRGYLHPKVVEQGAAAPWLVVGSIWTLFHLPLMFLVGYLRTARPWWTFGFFTVNCIADSYVWGTFSYGSASLLPAVWFHTFHNIFGQWLFPKLFPSAHPLLFGEAGLLPMLAHVVAVIAIALTTDG